MMLSPLSPYLHEISGALDSAGIGVTGWHAVRHRATHVGLLEWGPRNPACAGRWPDGISAARFPDGWTVTTTEYIGVPHDLHPLPLHPWAQPGDVAAALAALLAAGPDALPPTEPGRGSRGAAAPAGERWSGAAAAQAALDRLDPHGTDTFAG
ncbi:hypothetical protein [Streptacidiphilus sp. EB103A]|uniref:hypothetical protein n=1 Tax=Streptacidiphilus sp. EB103A TaxID=3156275 RepID=UPI0035118038